MDARAKMGDSFDKCFEKITETAKVGYDEYGFKPAYDKDIGKSLAESDFYKEVEISTFKMTMIEEMVKAVSESAKPVEQDTYFDDLFSVSERTLKTQAEKEIEKIRQE
jgi:hypothetical protein